MKWRDRSFQKGLGYDLEKMLYPVHRDMMFLIADKYQRQPYLKSLATEMALGLVKYVSDLVCWVDDTYESFLDEGNDREDVW